MFLGLGTNCISQEVQNFKFECLEDIKSGGKVFQPEIFKDSIQMSLKTHGPCDADFEVQIKEIDDGRVIAFEVNDNNKVYTGGKLKCGCFYRLQFKIANYTLKSDFRDWAINNHTVPKDIWELWYWDNLD